MQTCRPAGTPAGTYLPTKNQRLTGVGSLPSWHGNCNVTVSGAGSRPASSKSFEEVPAEKFFGRTLLGTNPGEVMAENVMDQIVAELRQSALEMFPGHTELKNVRVVGHTPKTDHYTYDIVVDFADASERVAAKVYRASKCGAAGAKQMARTEFGNLSYVHKIFEKKGLTGVPRPLGDFTEAGAVVTTKFTGVPLQSIIMKAALLPGYADHDVLKAAARKAGEWLRSFHKATADMPVAFDAEELLADLKKACERCRAEGLEESSIRTIVAGARSALARVKKALPHSAVLNDFTPLNTIVNEN